MSLKPGAENSCFYANNFSKETAFNLSSKKKNRNSLQPCCLTKTYKVIIIWLLSKYALILYSEITCEHDNCRSKRQVWEKKLKTLKLEFFCGRREESESERRSSRNGQRRRCSKHHEENHSPMMNLNLNSVWTKEKNRDRQRTPQKKKSQQPIRESSKRNDETFPLQSEPQKNPKNKTKQKDSQNPSSLHNDLLMHIQVTTTYISINIPCSPIKIRPFWDRKRIMLKLSLPQAFETFLKIGRAIIGGNEAWSDVVNARSVTDSHSDPKI